VSPAAGGERLSLNQMTIPRWTVREAVDGCARHGIRHLGLWREKVAEYGIDASARAARDAGVAISCLCRGGGFPAATAVERRARIDDNRQAIDEAAALGRVTLVLVCGPLAGCDIDGARRMVEDAIAELAPYAAERGVRLAIEPLHPMFAADRSVVATLAHATAIAERFPEDQVGVLVDAYHVWWDPTVYAEIARAGPRIFGFHISDWIVPLPDVLFGRGMMGDGVIELRRLRGAVDAAGYAGPVEVEIFNRTIHGMPGDDVLALMKERYLKHVA
jgi:sugar phosphate isomerase/epimerase